MIGHRRAPSRVPDVTHVTLSPKPFAFCKQSKIGGGNSLGTRLQNHRSSQDRSRNLSLTISTTFPGSIIGTLSRSLPGSIVGTFLKTRVYVPAIALRSKHHDVRMRNNPAYTNSLFLSHLAFHRFAECW